MAIIWSQVEEHCLCAGRRMLLSGGNGRGGWEMLGAGRIPRLETTESRLCIMRRLKGDTNAGFYTAKILHYSSPGPPAWSAFTLVHLSYSLNRMDGKAFQFNRFFFGSWRTTIWPFYYRIVGSQGAEWPLLSNCQIKGSSWAIWLQRLLWVWNLLKWF